MKAAILQTGQADGRFLEIEEVERPVIRDGYVLLRVIACGVCRTDLHIAEGDLPVIKQALIPGHQIVGEVIEGATAAVPLGVKVGVSWMGGTDGDCWYCQHDRENLCDKPTFTGYTVNGGYAEFALVRAGLSGAGAARTIARLAAFPFAVIYLLVYAGSAHARRTLRRAFQS